MNLIILLLILLIPLFSNITQDNLYKNDLNDNSDIEKLRNSRVVNHPNNLWIENPNFDGLGEPWESNIDGDTKDVIGTIAQNQANYKILGDSGELKIDDPLNDTDWILDRNPDLPILPTRSEINSSGCHVSHLWHEDVNQTHNRPSVRWKRIITMPVDMKDYIITSAALEVIFNATVTVSPHDGGGIERPGDYTEGQVPGVDTQFSIGDYTEFYVLVSDVGESFPPIRIAYNHTGYLGQDTPEVNNYTNTPMDVVTEQVLKNILTSVLATDGYNFTITLGIDIYCEDNDWGVDIDQWNSLIIRSFNLSFTFEKKIDQFTAISWEQIGDEITGTNIQITNANLTFKYKIDTSWPISSSPNSEIRVLINNNSLSETVKISTATASFQDAKEGGYDVTSLILKDVNITLSIQFFLADEFSLDHNITISIDDVYFMISYREIFPDIFSEPWVFTTLLIVASVVTAGISGYLIAYQRVLKYPRPVRKVRKFKRTLNKRTTPDMPIMPREIAFKKSYNKALGSEAKFLKLRPGATKVSKVIEKFKKKPEPTGETKIDSDQLIKTSLEKKEELDKLVEKLPEKPDS